MPTDPVTVLIVDDHAPFRRAAAAVVAATAGFTVVGEAASGEQALELAGALRPDVALVDINMPGLSGIETCAALVADHPRTVVVLVSTYAASDLPPEARTCGAAGYVNKEELSPAVLLAIPGIWSQ